MIYDGSPPPLPKEKGGGGGGRGGEGSLIAGYNQTWKLMATWLM